MQVENLYPHHWQTQAEMRYDGLGNRLQMSAAVLTTRYTLDVPLAAGTGGRVLSANAAGNITHTLYGLGPIGELTNTWNYLLPDGSTAPRQLTDTRGRVTLTISYTPWGDTLETYGTGRFTHGYFGGIMDSATGLIYIGSGQYYDPATGRFLTRDARPNQPNPYTPFDPTGFLLGPLALLALVYSRKKSRSKWDTLVILLALGCAVGMSLAACGPPTPETSPAPSPAPTQPQPTETPGADNQSGNAPTPAGMPSPTPSPTCTSTPTPTPTPGTIDEELALYGVRFTASPEYLMTHWTPERKTAVRNAVVDIANRFGNGAAGFRAVYKYIDFEWCIAGAADCAAIFGWAYGDHLVKFGGIYTNETQATRLVVHELGHLFDRMVCASRRASGECDDVFHNSARTDLESVWGAIYCGKDDGGNSYLCLGRRSHSGPDEGVYWGFAGGWQEWQFGATHGDGEVWADMFLAWVYHRWGSDRFGVEKSKYMNAKMETYLSILLPPGNLR